MFSPAFCCSTPVLAGSLPECQKVFRKSSLVLARLVLLWGAMGKGFHSRKLLS